MGQMNKVSKNNTTISAHSGGFTVVTLHQTAVVSFNEEKINLCTGGWKTVTTKARMNQAASQFDLPYRVYQQKGAWFVALFVTDEFEWDTAKKIPFVGDYLSLNRKTRELIP